MTEVEEFQEEIAQVEQAAQALSMEVKARIQQAKGLMQARIVELTRSDLSPEEESAIRQSVEAARRSAEALSQVEIDGIQSFARLKLEMQGKLAAYQRNVAGAQATFEARMKEIEQRTASENAECDLAQGKITQEFERKKEQLSQEIQGIVAQINRVQAQAGNAALQQAMPTQ